jgi:hypothetical protein
MAPKCDWAHHRPIGGGGLAGDGPSALAAAQVPTKLEAGKLNAWSWELEGS